MSLLTRPRPDAAALARVALALLLGCASFSEVPQRPAAAPRGATPPLSVHLWSAEKAFQRAGVEWTEAPASGRLVQDAEDAIWDSGWVKRSRGGGFRPALDLQLCEYQVTDTGLAAYLTGFLVPARLDTRLQLNLRLLEENRQTLLCERSAESRTWVQPFLVFVYLFRSPQSKEIETAEALALQCLAEVLEKRDATAAQ